MEYFLHIAITIGIYLIVAYSINILMGYGGLLSLSSAAFHGIGAYAYALISIHFGLSFFYALALSIFITAVIAYLIGIPALKFRGNLFVVVTLGFQVIIYTILYNWVNFTRGPYGIPGIPQPVLTLSPSVKHGITISSTFSFLMLTVFINILVLSFIFRIYKSPFGLVLKSLREDELAAMSLGKSPFYYQHRAFVISSALLAIAGALFASYITYIDPTSFTIDESIFQVVILIIGGSGNIAGPLLGTIFMVILPEALRWIGMPDTIAPNVRQIIYGIILMFLMYYSPQGIIGEYEIK